ncbi:hypothetical protein CEXT_578271 [Caerostris extrusa]|uniref:Uncharacterized protein n=1 Tax=Caerostris extrusa TaxID=172846 RepID=A0AAV4UEI9_CAEEX|nr:hypothetical protein CEXT_578271 [Caerostris extrusa]
MIQNFQCNGENLWQRLDLTAVGNTLSCWGIFGLSLGRPTELDIKHVGAADKLAETPISVFKEACTSTRRSADNGVGVVGVVRARTKGVG